MEVLPSPHPCPPPTHLLSAAATPRSHLHADGGAAASSSSDGTSSSTSGPLAVVLLVRADAELGRGVLAEQAARVVLGMFKKEYKRRNPLLRGWEEGGSRMRVRCAVRWGAVGACACVGSWSCVGGCSPPLSRPPAHLPPLLP